MQHQELEKACQFRTARLNVKGFAIASCKKQRRAFGNRLLPLLAPEVSLYLPPNWQGIEDIESALGWFDKISSEATLRGIWHHDRLIGLLVLASEPASHTLHIGYCFAKDYWGLGFAFELLSALQHWCHRQPDSLTLLAGVDKRNIASVRVLEKAGFIALGSAPFQASLYQWQPPLH
ncbi:GNAT family N-acetyltransferase [Aliiglaciecola sp. CAU 1673]|uniref:GNAT family N-acetyltransferase n=1 Tax=Aliiglaciecola sp. CAU 1673 TaxID=3032595 RepID=UPI0023DAA0A1|nr:GNAT family N-acetyltransferase [Aliiglaciecola sp. CAU 1673]MDF2178392.1 GNAT family N-acetyltransferase [Aliiglaciecola sp. CAU 1673]